MRAIACGAMVLALSRALAVEGLWSPAELADMPAVDGFDPSRLVPVADSPLAAVVDLGDCSAVFVSADGLLLTSRHCLPLERLPPGRDPAAAMLALDGAAEVHLPALRAYRTLDLVEVSATLEEAAGYASGAARQEVLERTARRLEHECEAAETALRCRVRRVGERWQLERQRVFQDLRLVWMPSRNSARFGGPAEDGAWPRHAADVALLRVRVGPGQQSAVHSADNEPFHPSRHLAPGGALGAGDPVAVAGFPGRSRPLILPAEVADVRDWLVPERSRLLGEILEALEAVVPAEGTAGRAIDERRLRLADRRRQDRALQAELARGDVEARRRRETAALKDWLMADQTLSGDFLDDLETLEQALVAARVDRESELILGLIRDEVELLALARSLYRHSLEPGARDGVAAWRRELRRERVAAAAAAASPAADRAVLAVLLDDYAALSPERRERALDQALGLAGAADPARLAPRLDALFQGATLADPAVALAWLERAPEDFRSAADPVIQLAVALVNGEAAASERRRRQRLERAALEERLAAAWRAWRRESDARQASGADGGLRVSFGRVAGYAPRDAVRFEPFTTLAGIRQKSIGDPSRHAVDPAMLDALKAREDSGSGLAGPVDFLSTCEVAPGLSGAPTLDPDGRLVGVVFDANPAALAASRVGGSPVGRAIHVDVRYLLWLLEDVHGAGVLAREMTAGSP